jgi:iron complex outermembrane receptor protein
MDVGYKYATGSLGKIEQRFIYSPVTKLNLTVGGTYESFFSLPQGADYAQKVDTRNALRGKILGSDLDADVFVLRYHNIGAYAEALYRPSYLLSLTLGARYDYNSRFGGTFNPRSGIVIRPTDKTNFKLLYGSAFLAPSPLRAFAHYGSFASQDGGQTYSSFFWHLPNPDLKPVRSHSVEANFEQYLGKHFAAQVTAYVTWLNNLRIDAPDAQFGNRYNGQYKGYPVAYIEVPVNFGEQQNYGGHIQLTYNTLWRTQNQLRAYASVSYIDGTVKQPAPNFDQNITVAIPYISTLTYRAGVEVHWDKFYFFPKLISMNEQRTAALTDDFKGRKTIPGYTLLNLAVGYELTPNIDLSVQCDNVLDTRYKNVNLGAFLVSEEMQGVPQLPRRIIGTLSFRL